MTEKVLKHFIDINAIGPGYGESILINISDSILIGIDSNKVLTQLDQNSNSLIENITRKFKKDKIYWILTHYHFDHFQNFINVYNKFPEKSLNKIIHPAEYTETDYNEILREHTKSKTNNKIKEKESSNEYQKILRLINDLDYKGLSISNGVNELIKINLIDDQGVEKQLKILIFAPTKEYSNGLRAKALKKIEEQRAKINRDGEIINSTSYIIHLEYGNNNLLFLADAPIERITSILKVPKENSYDVIKISHHGSKTGTNKELINKIRSSKKQYGIIIPYDVSNLPHKDIIQLYEENGFEIINTKKGTNSKNKRSIENALNNIDYTNNEEFEIVSAMSAMDCIATLTINI